MGFEDLLNEKCNILKLTGSQDSTSGEDVKTWSPIYVGVSCRLDQASGSEISGSVEVYSKATHILFLSDKYNLNSKENRVKIGNDEYNILLVKNAGGHNHHIELVLEIRKQ